VSVSELEPLLARIRGCTTCPLPHGPRPVVRAARGARIAVIGQAPGSKVHASGVPWDDPSGENLVDWLGVGRATFDDPERFAVVPMGFCYPGKGASGDLPPRKECAPQWHGPLLAALPGITLTLLVGTYAQAAYLPDRRRTLTATVQAGADWLPAVLPLPHPSWRSRIWRRKNPWFDEEFLPILRARVAEALQGA
jgi:uracil-DNA glycosylase